MQDRMNDLEAKFSFQEDTLQQLNEIIIQQRRVTDELKQKVVWLEAQVGELLAGKENNQVLSGDEEKPPHY